MGKVIPTASFRRASAPDPQAVHAFVELDQAPPALAIVPNAPAPSNLMAVEMLTPAVEVAEAQGPEQPASSSSSHQVSPAKWRRKVLRRADGRELRKQTFYLDAELSHQLMVTCATHQYDLSEAIEEAVNLWLSKGHR